MSRAQTPREVRKAGAAETAAVTVATLASALNEIAPPYLAAEWDNVGLLTGRPEWPVTRVLLAIDLTDAVAREALETGASALILYHPPIFKGIRNITPQAECPTALLPDLLAARISLLAVHTALDAAVGGTNDVLLDFFEPVSRRPLELHIEERRTYKLVVFVLPNEVDALRRALSDAGAGVIGHYSECSYALAGQGTFRGDETTRPTVGEKLRLETVDETRLEMVVPRARLGEVVRALYATHSYEEPAFDLYPLHETPGRAAVGMGRVGILPRPERGDVLLGKLRRHVDLSAALVVGRLKRSFRSVTAAAGAFGVRAFADTDSLVLTGEFKHHDALELQKRGVTAVHLGHYASERPALESLRARLSERVAEVTFETARADKSPLSPVRLE
ncbi:MAG: Nif3-like dinuclear metal center hexameric protein [Phycisphaerae bacterium]|nr:Nif3-like dinuclear metal center hexameric protein [Phycisphaerae bacterium]HOO15722.1 Nif3-like dinuclear metal center hexameric protein [Phycisphaerae bacterium]